MRASAPPSEWSQQFLSSLRRQNESDGPDLSSQERRHLRRTKLDAEDYAPAARELAHRSHEMMAGLVGSAAWDPNGLLSLPRDVVRGVSDALERRGCRSLGLAEALCLPFLLYSTDTVYILRICTAMRNLKDLSHSNLDASSVEMHLGVWAGVICALVEAGGLLRRETAPEKLLPVLGMQTAQFLSERQLVFRGVWMPKDFRVRDLCRCYNLTSWSLWASGALSVLKIYRRCVSKECSVPVLIIMLRSEIMRLALPTTALYFAASPDGEAAGKHDRPHERLPPSRLRPGRSDGGAAQVEKEILLPPFARLLPLASVPLADLRRSNSSDGVAQRVGEAWQLGSEDTHRMSKELGEAWKDATDGRRALKAHDADRCVCLFVSGIKGSWFDDGPKGDLGRTGSGH